MGTSCCSLGSSLLDTRDERVCRSRDSKAAFPSEEAARWRPISTKGAGQDTGTVKRGSEGLVVAGPPNFVQHFVALTSTVRKSLPARKDCVGKVFTLAALKR